MSGHVASLGRAVRARGGAPQYDGPGQVTALFAANALFEMLSLVALAPRDRAA